MRYLIFTGLLRVFTSNMYLFTITLELTFGLPAISLEYICRCKCVHICIYIHWHKYTWNQCKLTFGNTYIREINVKLTFGNVYQRYRSSIYIFTHIYICVYICIYIYTYIMCNHCRAGFWGCVPVLCTKFSVDLAFERIC